MPNQATPLIVVIENDTQLAIALALLLEDWGYGVVHAPSAAVAVRALGGRVTAVQAIIVEYMLDDGFTGIKGAAALAKAIGQPVPTIVTTGHSERAEHEELFPVLRKPFDPSVLYNWLRYHVPHSPRNVPASAA